MIELCNYIYENYPGLKDKVEYWQLLSLLDRNEDKIIFIKEGNEFKGAALYTKPADESLWQIEYGFLNIDNPQDIQKILSEKGDNVHFLYVLADSYRTIMKGLREVIKRENPKTISWFSPDMKMFNKFEFKREVKLCHQ